MAQTPERAYPYPTINEAPAGPYSFEQLALAVENDMEYQVARLEILEEIQRNRREGTIGLLTTNANGDGNFPVPGGAFNNALTAAVLTDATDPTKLGALIIKWTSASSTKTTVTFRVYDAAGNAIPNIGVASNLAVGYVLKGY